MDIRKLRIFMTAAQCKSFTRAAEELFMTQPAVSKAVHELEKEAGTPLFERYPKQVVLTPAGKILFEKSRSLLAQYRKLEQELPKLDGQSRLSIGSSITIANDRLPKLLLSLGCRFPGVKLQVEVASAAAILEKLNEDRLDAALLEGTVSADWADSRPFSSYTIHAVCAPSFAENHPVHSLSDFTRLPLLMREPGSAIRDKTDSFFLLHDLPLAPCFISTNSNALLQAALQGLGIAFLPQNMIQKKLSSRLLTELCVPGLFLENQNYFVCKKQKHLNEPLLYLKKLLIP